MTQYQDIPLPGDQRNVSQADIRNNFNYLCTPVSGGVGTNGILPVDHFATSDNGANPTDGFHKQISFLDRSTPTNLTNSINSQASSSILYTLTDGSGNSQLHFYNGTDYTLTPSRVISTGTLAVTSVAQTIATVPANCVGFLVMHVNGTTTPGSLHSLISFFSISGSLYVGAHPYSTANLAVGFSTAIFATASGLNIQVQAPINNTYAYKLVYWAT
jgi:hypothetical protein